jgi:catechol-2,3-dioxygenase
MTDTVPTLLDVDHVHVYVNDRAAAERWYGDVLGLRRVEELELWATDRGPLTIANPSGTVHIALFERPAQVQKRHSTIALSVTARDFAAWKRHLEAALGKALEVVDHDLSLSMYFTDPDGNPYEITTNDHESARAVLGDTHPG